MCSISNGLAAYSPGTFIPVTSSFFIFYIYAAPAVRMSALQRLQTIHVATHDSIGTGEDGPTHQPIELAALYRAMPNLLYIRPGDSEEVAGAWEIAIKAKQTPSILSLSRQKIPQLTGLTKRSEVQRGAYVLIEDEGADVTLIGVGAELSFAVSLRTHLKKTYNITARVVSFPSWRLFESQSREYKRGVLRRHGTTTSSSSYTPAVVIEPYSPQGWERYADAGICMYRFGHSLPGKEAYKFFGYEDEVMGRKVHGYLERLKQGEVERGEFVEL